MNTAGPATHRADPARSLFESLAALARQVLDFIASMQMRRAERQIMRLGRVKSPISQRAYRPRALPANGAPCD